MDSYDDADRLRARRNAAEAEASRRAPASARGAPCVLARVETTSGSAASRFYNMTPIRLQGEATEGSSGVRTDMDWTFLAVNIGTRVPPVGTQVLCTGVRDRWSFQY